MIQFVSILLLVGLSIACLLSIGLWRKNKQTISKKLTGAYIIWFLLSLGSGVYIAKTAGEVGLGLSAQMQILFYAIAGIIIVLMYMKYGGGSLARRAPILGLFVYGILALLSTAYAPAPLITIYKASVIILDVVAVMAVVNLLVRYGRPSLIFDVGVMTAILFVVGAFIGVLIRPEIALRPIYGVGAFGFILDGTLPYMNGNELGFLSAVVSLVAVSRVFNPSHGAPKLFWLFCGAIGLSGMVFAQARTSIVGFSVGLFILSIAIPKLRNYAIGFGIVGALLLVVLAFVGQANLDVGGEVGGYLAKGQADHGMQSIEGRYYMWKNLGSRMIFASPILGHGFETGLLFGGEEYGLGHMHMHNSHVQILINSGLIGYMPWLFVTTWVFFKFTSIIRRSLKQRSKYKADPKMYEIYAVYVLLCLRTMTGSVMLNHGVTFIILIGTMVYILCSERIRLIAERKVLTNA